MSEFTTIEIGHPWRPQKNRMVKDDQTGIWERRNINRQPVSTVPLSEEAASLVPKHVLTVDATESPYLLSGHLYSLVSVSFTRDAQDTLFAGVRIWFKGYKTNPEFIMMADGLDSPVSFLCDPTKETVTVAVQAVGADGVGADLDTAPTTTVPLDGVVSAPPPPTVHQGRVALAGGAGWQFSFNLLNGLPSDLVVGYWIYHNTSATEPIPPNNRFLYIPHAASNVGIQTVQEFTSSTMYYWVSAVNSNGLESTLTSVEDGEGEHIPVTVLFYPTAYSGNYANPYSAYDGNETTYSSSGSGQEIWSGFQAATGSPISIELEIMHSTKDMGGDASELWYSTDAGSTWNFIEGEAEMVKHYVSRSLSPTQDLTLVKVKAIAAGNPHRVYEIHIKVTT